MEVVIVKMVDGVCYWVVDSGYELFEVIVCLYGFMGSKELWEFLCEMFFGE